MTTESNTYPPLTDEELTPMEPNHFAIAIRQVAFKTEEHRKALEAVLVGGMGVDAAAKKFNVAQSTLSESAKAARVALNEWAAANRLKRREFLLFEEDVETIEKLEKRTLEPILKQDEINNAPRKKRAARYAAKKQKKEEG